MRCERSVEYMKIVLKPSEPPLDLFKEKDDRPALLLFAIESAVIKVRVQRFGLYVQCVHGMIRS
mgnify:CR=1 FL=1